MESTKAIQALAALAQPTRLDAFRLLVEQEPHGLPAGQVADRLAVPHNTMSSHLATLSRAGLVTSERRSREIVYRARLGGVQDLVAYLLRDCCGGHPEICTPLVAELIPCCTPVAVQMEVSGG